MKASFRILAACLAASLALVSCDKENITKTDNNETKDGARTIIVSFSPSTRSALGNDGLTPHFTTGDEIMLANGAGNTEKVTVSVSGSTATATTTLTGELKAVYPASASTDGINYTVSSSQDGTFAKANICTATIPDGANPTAEFVNQTAILKFSVPAKVDNKGVAYSPKKISVKSGGSNNIADGGKEITITGKDGGAIATSDGGFYYMAVLPGETISKLTICSGDGIRCPTASGTLAANTIYDVTLPVLNGREYVELEMTVDGVTKTLKWATMNVGASSSTDAGLYFMWGETTGHAASTNSTNAFVFGTDNAGFAWSNCPYAVGSDDEFTKYVPSGKTEFLASGFSGDTLTKLESSDDAATTNWGGAWRMPTVKEFDGLAALNPSYEGWDDVRKGVVITDAKGNSIFLPAAGLGDGTNLEDADEYGLYWSSSLDTENPFGSYSLYMEHISENYVVIGTDGAFFRCGGQCVRPISN